MEQYFDKLNVSNLQVPQQLKYMNICRRLHMQELAEENYIKYTTIQIQLEEMRSVEYYTLILSKYTSIEETMEEIFMLFKYVDKFVESHITQE
ncbi:coiled-coil domain-containing protein [Holotrichia oblita]|uniref:Coiled-coil domain-containing protein n=1 Tax=Holotrichia oblita TaxID=644536 RepID=A0ACB9TU96_HOLOL|nr:coiled-coil domain-containing protein [Holotrichia oblita]